MLIISAAATDIVGSLEDDEFIHTCLPQDITVETLHGRFAQSALYHTVATDSEIQHAIWFLCIQGIREEIGPAVLMVSSTSTAIGNRVSEDSYHRGSLIGLHINGRKIVPVVSLLLLIESCICRFHRLALYITYYIRGSTRTTMGCCIHWSLLAIVDGNRKALSTFQGIFQIIREDSLARSNGYILLAIKLEILHRLGIDSPIAWNISICNIHRFDFYRLLTLLVAELHSEFLSSKRYMNYLSARTVAQAFLRHISFTSPFHCSSPSSFPYLLGKSYRT